MCAESLTNKGILRACVCVRVCFGRGGGVFMGRHRRNVWFFCMFGIPLERLAMQKVWFVFRGLLPAADEEATGDVLRLGAARRRRHMHAPGVHVIGTRLLPEQHRRHQRPPGPGPPPPPPPPASRLPSPAHAHLALTSSPRSQSRPQWCQDLPGEIAGLALSASPAPSLELHVAVQRRPPSMHINLPV